MSQPATIDNLNDRTGQTDSTLADKYFLLGLQTVVDFSQNFNNRGPVYVIVEDRMCLIGNFKCTLMAPRRCFKLSLSATAQGEGEILTNSSIM